jgi:hypothetical protein
MDDRVNYGIIGDVKDIGALAVGPRSRVEVTNVQQPVAEQLQALAQAVEAFTGPAEARAELLEAHREVVGELRGPKPDRGKVLAKLRQIAEVAGSASTIAGAATALASAIQLL